MFNLRLKWSASPSDVDRIFNALGEDLRDFSPAMLRVRQVLAEMFREIFSSQGGAIGSQWAPPSPETMRRKLSAGSPTASLRLTGALEEAFTDEAGGSGAIRRISTASEGLPKLIYGTRLAYAAPLHFGGKRLPSRRILGFTTEGEESAVGELQRHLEAKLSQTARALSAGGTA